MNNDIDKSRKIAEYLSAVMQNKSADTNDEFEEWIHENSSAMDILEELSDADSLTHRIENFNSVDRARSAKGLLEKINRQKRRRIFGRISSAVAAVAVVSFLLFNYMDVTTEKQIESEVAMLQEADGVRIVLDDGEVLELNNSEDTIKRSDLFLKKSGVEGVEFISDNKDTISKISISKLIVPNKNKYSITLSDGTLVMLNAGSELVFPNKFGADKREVELKGEGYFEVAKNQEVPFIVRVNGTAIRVYGTKFNINSHNEPIVETLLIEGSIGVTLKDKEQILKPNQMYQADTKSGSGRISLISNIRKYIGWTKGYFVFEADDLSKVTEELSRWYNVKFVIEGERKMIPITGSFSHDTELDEIIKTLEIISGVKLTKEEYMIK